MQLQANSSENGGSKRARIADNTSMIDQETSSLNNQQAGPNRSELEIEMVD